MKSQASPPSSPAPSSRPAASSGPATPPPTGLAPRRRLQVLAAILLISAVLSVRGAGASSVLISNVALTAIAAVAVWLASRPRALDPRVARAAIGLVTLRVAFGLALQLELAGITAATLLFNVGLPAFYLYYLIAAIREIRREAAA
jgi:hypothetical protein